MFKRVIIAVVLVLIVAGCAPDHGRVEGRSYRAAYTWTSLDCAATSTYRNMRGQSFTQCSLWLQHSHYVQPKYWLRLKTSKHEGDHQVTAYEYRHYPTGAQYP